MSVLHKFGDLLHEQLSFLPIQHVARIGERQRPDPWNLLKVRLNVSSVASSCLSFSNMVGTWILFNLPLIDQFFKLPMTWYSDGPFMFNISQQYQSN